jgi:methyl-accepting chemotaxis protein
MTAAERRKKFLVEKKIQLKHTVALAVSFLVILLLAEWQMWLLLSKVLPAVTFRASEGYIFRSGLILMGEFFVFVVILAVLNIFYLHRLIGPLPRLRQEIENMLKSGNIHLLRVRRNDEMAEFIAAINRLMEKIAAGK